MVRGTAYDLPVDWLQFQDPDRANIMWNINMTFMVSGWECLYGRGCPGHFGITDRYITPDLGCCTDSFYIEDEEDEKRIAQRITELTDADWDKDLRQYVEKHGWKYNISKEETKGKVFQGGCVFANRIGGSSGKPGCAFLALANRLGEEVSDATDEGHVSHTKFMPNVCHTLPFKTLWDMEDEDHQVVTIDAWDAGRWTEGDPYADNEEWMMWWCVDSPEAYGNKTPLYVRMKDTLVQTMGENAYNLMCGLIKERTPVKSKMGGTVNNGGRPLLPVVIGGRKPKRPDPNFEIALKEMSTDGRT